MGLFQSSATIGGATFTIETGRMARQAGGSVVVVLHDLTLAARFCDRLVLLGDGQIIADGTPDMVLTDKNLAAAYRISVQQGGSGDTRYVVPWRRLPD